MNNNDINSGNKEARIIKEYSQRGKRCDVKLYEWSDGALQISKATVFDDAGAVIPMYEDLWLTSREELKEMLGMLAEMPPLKEQQQ